MILVVITDRRERRGGAWKEELKKVEKERTFKVKDQTGASRSLLQWLEPKRGSAEKAKEENMLIHKLLHLL